MNPILIVGALLGLLAVAFGALAEHLLLPGLEEAAIRRIDVAMDFHRFGALVVTAIGLVLPAVETSTRHRPLRWAGGLLAAGTVLFSFTICLTAVSGIALPGPLTPLGGLLQLVGWMALIWVGWHSQRLSPARKLA